MLSLAREMQEKLQVVLKTNLIRVPKKLKKMTLNEFVAEFGPLPHVNCGGSAVSDENAGVGLPQTAVKGSGKYSAQLIKLSFFYLNYSYFQQK